MPLSALARRPNKMSESSNDECGNCNNNGNNNNKPEDSFCRDFLRGMCERKICKFRHETESKMLLNFCHDFQNNFMCPRPNCKFIHCTSEEEDVYKTSGVMSAHIIMEASRKNQLVGFLPVCNQFKKGRCRRSICKYRHISRDDEYAEIMELVQNNCGNNNNNNNNNNTNKTNIANILNNNNINQQQHQLVDRGMNSPTLTANLTNHRRSYEFDDYDSPTLPKRRFIEQEILTTSAELQQQLDNSRMARPIFKGYYAGNPPSPMLSRVDARSLMLEEENNMLHKEIAQLKRQVSDLTATNEFLLDQNANLRNSNKRNEGVNIPAVTITNTNTPQVIRTVTASVATVPVSLATVSTCNPVSVSLAGCPTVSMAQPAQILAPSQQILVTTNPSNQLALANSSQAQLAIAQQNLANNLAAQQGQPQLTTQAQQLALATTTQQLTLANTQPLSQAQQLANQQLTNQQLTSQAQQLALANSTQQLTSQTQLGPQHLTVTSVPQQLLAQQNQQIEMHRTNQMNAISTSQAIAMSNSTQPMVSYPIMTQAINHALAH